MLPVTNVKLFVLFTLILEGGKCGYFRVEGNDSKHLCSKLLYFRAFFSLPALSKSSLWKKGLLETDFLPLKLFIVLPFSFHSCPLVESSGIRGVKLWVLRNVSP